jgi:hypothetical protein
LSKSIGMSSRTRTFFSYKLHQYWFRILNVKPLPRKLLL